MLRLNYLMELYNKDVWSRQFSKLPHRALKLRYAMESHQAPCSRKERTEIMGRFPKPFTEPRDPNSKKVHTFFKRILRNKNRTFIFLTDLAVPPDNNSSERDICNIKVKQKVSGQFKADHAAMKFAKIRSVIDTSIKNAQNVIMALRLINRAGAIYKHNLYAE
jgi:transposase